MSKSRARRVLVADKTKYKRRYWRDAITHYLNGVWRGDEYIMAHANIRLGDIRLWLDQEAGTYRACYDGGVPDDQPDDNEPPVGLKPAEILRIGPQQIEVEQYLIRFVRNDAIKMFTLSLEGSGILYLWKKEVRGDYGIAGHQLELDPLLEIKEKGEED